MCRDIGTMQHIDWKLMWVYLYILENHPKNECWVVCWGSRQKKPQNITRESHLELFLEAVLLTEPLLKMFDDF
jgi:hypothetical protein